MNRTLTLTPALLVALLTAACGEKETDDTDDTTTPSPLACGELTCDGHTEYCYSFTGGQPDTDGEDPPTCEPLPEACIGDVTCACLEAADPDTSPFCEEVEGGLNVSVAAP